MSKMDVKKHTKRNPALALAVKNGWTASYTKGTHIRVMCPHGCCTVIIAVSGSDHRGDANSKSRIRNCPGAAAAHQAAS